MIDLYYWPTPNGHKVTLFLEEAGLEYAIKPVDIGKGAQFDADFLRISPNNKMPAIVDHAPADGGAPISVFESCSTSPTRPAASSASPTARTRRPRCASASRSTNGCSGRWPGWAR